MTAGLVFFGLNVLFAALLLPQGGILVAVGGMNAFTAGLIFGELQVGGGRWA